jgi:hypothetical protein
LIDTYLTRLLEMYPAAFFLPRLHLNTPGWWKDAHPEELIQYGLPTRDEHYDVVRKGELPQTEGGFYYRANAELREASFASKVWRNDTANMLNAFLAHMEESPLVSRVIGYHPTTGRTSEWNYFGEGFLPDYSEPMRKAVGSIPDAASRMRTTYGLLRDPAKESNVIQFYAKYHSEIADTVLTMARTVKKATHRRILCGVYYGYVTEQPRIQEGGYQAAQKVLDSPDIDYIASPYSYQPGNAIDERGNRVTMVDGAGNRLGHARGVGGDGAYRVPVESLRRRGKLFVVELDPSTYRDAAAYKVIGGHGGQGSDTLEGSLKILQRDMGGVFAAGVGGWLVDFGPLNKAPDGWYSGEDIISEIRRLHSLGKHRPELNIQSAAEICAVYDLRSFAATVHWQAGRPWKNYGIKSTDYFNHWFLATQGRAFHRIGAPVDGLYRFDLEPSDAKRYRLIMIVNAFHLTREESERIRGLLRGSGATVLWYYAPGFVGSARLNLRQMEQLTGFQFSVLEEPGPMMIRSEHAEDNDLAFGVDENHYPRFVVRSSDVESLGEWVDGVGVAFARREYEGYNSVYVGSAPVPVQLLRRLAQEGGVRLWSTRNDIVCATHDAAMIVATEQGPRTLTLPRPMVPVRGGEARLQHALELEYGEVRVFVVS